jgi:hypothetical protein
MRRPEAWRLPVARSAAWALLVGGWLALGELGRSHWPLWADGLGALALWLAAVGGALAVTRGRRRTTAAMRWQLPLAGLLCAGPLLVLVAGGPRWVLALLAPAWGAALVAASHAVRLLRAARPDPARPAPPFGPALAGAALAWAVAGSGMALATMLLLVPVGLALLLPSHAAAGACRAGLFDCALPLADAPPWRDPAAWPAWAARSAMLPMMAALAGMSAWCSAVGWPAPAMTAAHLAAMLLPPWLLRHRVPGRIDAAVMLLALAAGLLAVLARPGLDGLMAASLCHAVAWGLAWRLALACPAAPRPATAAVWRPALAVLLLGVALAATGPVALMVLHGLLGALALAGAMMTLLHSHQPEVPR